MLPLNVARELELTGAALSSERAYQAGFVNLLTMPGDVLETASRLASEIAQNAPLSVRTALQATNDFAARDDSLGRAFAELARDAIDESADAVESIAVFLEKRWPQWSGQ